MREAPADIRVGDAPDRSRFEIQVGGEVAGFSEYRRRPGVIAFVHTLTDPRFEGQGLASQLVRTALTEARSDGLPEPASTRKRYTGLAVDVSFDPARCRHAAECLRGLPAVFDRGRRPWILPDGGKRADVVRVVARCPTGALRAHPRGSAAPEQPATPTDLVALPGGPVLVRGDLHVTAPSGLDEHETRAALCSCGPTAHTPYCDGGGTCGEWPHPQPGRMPT